MELFLKMRKDKCVAKGEVQTKKEGDHVAWVSHDVFTIGYLVIYALQSSVCYLVHCNIFSLATEMREVSRSDQDWRGRGRVWSSGTPGLLAPGLFHVL